MKKTDSLWYRLWHYRPAAISLTVILLYLLLAVGFECSDIVCRFRNIVPLPQQSWGEVYSPPSLTHLLGTDYQGRDVLLRAAAASATALKVGVISGLVAGFMGLYNFEFNGKTPFEKADSEYIPAAGLQVALFCICQCKYQTLRS